MGKDYYKGLPKVRRSRGTVFYYVRNYIALGVIGVSIAAGTLLHFSPVFKSIIDLKKEGYFAEDPKKYVFSMKTLAGLALVPHTSEPPQEPPK